MHKGGRRYERLCILRPGQRAEDLGLPYTAVGYPELRSAATG